MSWHKDATGKWKIDWYKVEVEAFTAANLRASGSRVEIIPGTPWDEETNKATHKVMGEMLQQFEWPTHTEDVQDINDLDNKAWKDPERPTRNYWGFSEGLIAMRAITEREKKTAVGYDGFTGVRQQVKRAGQPPKTQQAPLNHDNHPRSTSQQLLGQHGG